MKTATFPGCGRPLVEQRKLSKLIVCQIDLLQLQTEARFLVYNTWKGTLNATFMSIVLSQLCSTLWLHLTDIGQSSQSRSSSTFKNLSGTLLALSLKASLADVFFRLCQSFNGQYSGRRVKEGEKKKKSVEGRNKEKELILQAVQQSTLVSNYFGLEDMAQWRFFDVS